MNKVVFFAHIFLLTLFSQSLFASDIDTLYTRYWELSTLKSDSNKVKSILKLLNEDGSFNDIDYKSKNNISNHLSRLHTLAGAYQTETSIFYQDSTLKNLIYSSLQFWVNTDHRPSNWWFRHIGYPKSLGMTLFLMNQPLRNDNPSLFDETIAYLMWAYNRNDHMEGANGADKIFATLPAAILTKNEELLLKLQKQVQNLITVQSEGEGIESDWMYAQHSFNGRQLYGNYQQEYLNSILSFLDICRGTQYQVSSEALSILDSLFIEGIQWYVYKKRQDPAQTGRRPSSRLNSRIVPNLDLLIAQNSPAHDELIQIRYQITNYRNAEFPLTGNRLFWRFDYMIHRREHFFSSSRVTSKRTMGMESGNGEGENNYYTSAGLNFLFRTGKEYDFPFFNIMNPRQWPGTTAEQGNAKLPGVDWGKNSSNNHTYGGGVSDQQYGTIGFVYRKRGLEAYKSWFFFDREIVALGSGISHKNGKSNVYTTLNQTIQETTIHFSSNFYKDSLNKGGGQLLLWDPIWVIQDSIAYLNLPGGGNFVISSELVNDTPLFSLGIDHGISPTNGSYAYLIYPNCTEEMINEYKSNLPIQILSHTDDIHAVYHQELKIAQIHFYQAGTLLLPDSITLTVDAPCAVLINMQDTLSVTVGDPLGELSNKKEISLSFKFPEGDLLDNQPYFNLQIELPQGNKAGSSVTHKVIRRKD